MSSFKSLSEHVRKKPGMYIGGTDERALNNCIWELLVNSIEEHLAGRGSIITVTIHSDGSLSVQDNGGGISVEVDPEHNLPWLEAALTDFTNRPPSSKASYVLGLRGVGVKCVNAVSEWMQVNTVWQDVKYEIGFARGLTVEPLRKIHDSGVAPGTTVRFKPDREIFRTVDFDRHLLAKRLDWLAILHPALEFWLVDERPNSANRPMAILYHYPKGIADFLKVTFHGDQWYGYGTGPFAFSGNIDGMKIALGFQLAQTANSLVLSFVNSSRTELEGTHVDGFLQGLADGLSAVAGSPVPFTPHDVRRGICAVVAIWHAEPRYGGATKDELINPEVGLALQKFTRKNFSQWAADHEREAKWLAESVDERR